MTLVHCRERESLEPIIVSAVSFHPTPADEELEEDHFTAPVILAFETSEIKTNALIDCGGTGYAFMDESFAQMHNFPLIPLKKPRELQVVDGRPISSGSITHLAFASMTLGQHHENYVPFFVTTLGHYSVVLGVPWMRKHQVQFNYTDGSLIFPAAHCKEICLAHSPAPANWKTSPSSSIPQTPSDIPSEPKSSAIRRKALDLHFIGAAPFRRLAKDGSMQIATTSLRDIEKALQPKEVVDPATLLPRDYHEFLDVFSHQESDKLPPHREYDHKIKLQPGKEPPFGPLYGMSQGELHVLKNYLEENLSKGFIRASRSPAAAPVLFARKPGGGLRFCVDYRALNAMTVKDRYPLPLFRETLDRLSKAKIYTKIDIIAAFNKLRIAEGDEYKTAFRTRYGLYEYLVMPFGLCNAPSSFQHYINDNLREYLDIFCTAYIDDILIYSNNAKEHRDHVRKVLERLRAAGLQADIKKCEFHVEEVKYLGLVISTQGIRMDPEKVAAVRDWESPANVKDVQSFLGFANFYRRFIKGFSRIAGPLTKLTGKNNPFIWSADCQQAFDKIKDSFDLDLILMHYDPDKPVILETDSSDHVNAGIMSQYGDEGILRPIAFFSHKMSSAECNYEIYDKELLSIIRCFEEWRPELEGSSMPIQVITDHKNLEYFMSTKLLNRRQARWAEFLSRFNFVITYRPGSRGTKPDALTRRSGDLPQNGEDERILYRNQVVLKPHNLRLDATQIKNRYSLVTPLPYQPGSTTPARSIGVCQHSLDQLIEKAYKHDPYPNEIIQMIEQGIHKSRDITLAECEVLDGRLFYQKRLFVPDYDPLKLFLVQRHHDDPAAGHSGRSKTIELMLREYYWPGLYKYVSRYVKNCDTCQRIKPSRDKYQGRIKLLPAPEERWRDLSMDFVGELPNSEGFNAILVVTDRLTKMRHLIPCHTTATATDTATMFFHYVFKLHGLPNSIVSDRGTQFVAEFWRSLCQLLGIQARLSTAYHPESDGQTERFNAVAEQYLRAYINYQQDDWSRWLPLAEFSANNQDSATTKLSPFAANYGYNPRFSLQPSARRLPSCGPLRIQAQQAHNFVEEMKRIQDYLREEMVYAQQYQEEQANTRRTPAPAYKVGDEVFLLTSNIKTDRPSKKLDYKKLGRFKVLEVISPYAYKLDLPRTLRLHPVFHTSLLRRAGDDPVPGQSNAPPPPVEVDGDEEYKVQAIVNSRYNRSRRRFEYRVQWEGYDSATWEPTANVKNSPDLVAKFHSSYPEAPKPSLAPLELRP